MAITLMAIDDDEYFVYLMERACKKLDFVTDFQSAVHGKDALDKFNKWLAEDSPLPDLVFVDINMPVMDGFEFLEHFKKLKAEHGGKLASNIVAMLTSSDNEKDREKALSFGVISKYIVKPSGVDGAREIITDMAP